jgi:hypothetical protein
MDNHYHILLRTILPNLSKAMRHLDGLYTRRFNISERRDGPIFRGRYKAILIEKESYLLQVSRYIHLNPIEAKICNDPVDYPWSSYSNFIKKDKQNVWTNTDLILSHFIDNNRYDSYRKYVQRGVDDETVKLYKKASPIFGSNQFINQILASTTAEQNIFSTPDINKATLLPTIQHVSIFVAQYFSINLEDLKISVKGKNNFPRNIAIYLSRRLGQCSHQEISNYFTNLTIASVSTCIRRFEENLLSNFEIKNHLEKIIQNINKEVDL